MIRRELHIFLTAVMFYTRIPCPSWVDHSEELLNQSTRYFPLIGWIVGIVTALVYWACQLALPDSVSMMFSIISGILLTGAFHEDGFADVCDGFGGGWTKEKILTIMKDSAVGAYGAIGITLLLATKFVLLWEIADQQTPLTTVYGLVAGHGISRLNAVWVVYTGQYARANDDTGAKAKPIAKQMSFGAFAFANLLGIAPLAVFGQVWILVSLVPLFLVRIYLVGYFKKWIGGYTGDCLGAVQQVSEIVFYTFLLVLWKYIS